MITPAIKPTIAFRPISRGLITAARNSVNRVQESTQKISKGLNRNEKFAMNYVEFFGSKKTTKILKKNLKSVRDSLMSAFSMVKTLKENVAKMSKGGLGAVGGALGGITGILGKGLLGGILGKAVLFSLIGLATGGITFFLYKNAAKFFQFLDEIKYQLAPIINELIQKYLQSLGLPTGVPELISEVDKNVDKDISKLLIDDPSLTNDEAVQKSVENQIDVIQGKIDDLKLKRKDLKFFDITGRAEIGKAIQRLEQAQEYLKSGDKFTNFKYNPLAKFLFNRFTGGTPIPRGYNNMTTDQRTSTVVNFVENSPKSLETLEFEILRSSKLAGNVSAGEAKVRFYEDVLNYIKAKKEGNKKYEVLPEQFDVNATRKWNIEEFKNRFGNLLDYKPSSKNKKDINIIKDGGTGNTRRSGVGDGEKISANSSEGGFLGVKMLSALNQDFAMERALSKRVLSAYM